MRNLPLILFLLSFASSSLALTIKPGRYSGLSADNSACSLTVTEDGAIGLYYKGAFGHGVTFYPKNQKLEGNTLTVSGSVDMASAKARITLANDGTPVEALMGTGPFLKIFYDVNCKDLN